MVYNQILWFLLAISEMKRKTMILIRPSKVFEHHCSLSTHSEKIMLASEKWRYIIDIKNANDKLNWKAFTNRGKPTSSLKKRDEFAMFSLFINCIFVIFTFFSVNKKFFILNFQKSIHYKLKRLHLHLKVLQPVVQLQAFKSKKYCM